MNKIFKSIITLYQDIKDWIYSFSSPRSFKKDQEEKIRHFDYLEEDTEINKKHVYHESNKSEEFDLDIDKEDIQNAHMFWHKPEISYLKNPKVPRKITITFSKKDFISSDDFSLNYVIHSTAALFSQYVINAALFKTYLIYKMGYTKGNSQFFQEMEKKLHSP